MSSLSLEEYSNVLFDCDGVLLDSNEAKDVAFKKVLDGYDVELQDSFVEFVREHRGLSRYAKFEWFVSNCLGYNVTSMSFTSEVDKLLHKFSDINSSTLLKCEVVSETKFWAAKPFLQEQSWFVISAADHNELCRVLEARSLSESFEGGIFGSPATKFEIIEMLKADGRLGGSCLFFGDSVSDFDVAKYFGFDFAFVSGWSSSIDRDLMRQVDGVFTVGSIDGVMDDFLSRHKAYGSVS